MLSMAFKDRLLWMICVLSLAALSSCEFLKMKDVVGEDQEAELQPVARVHDTYLYTADLEGLVPEGTSVEDSANRVDRYVNNWIRQQLLIEEAATRIDFDEAEIQRKISDYRYSLMGYQYLSYHVRNNLNMEVTSDEIDEYYQANLDNFPLKQNIIRGRFVKVPVQTPRISEVQRRIKSTSANDIEALREFCLTYSTLYSLEDSVWINFEEIIKNTPLAELPNKVDFLKRNKYIEFNDEESLYFLKINEYKITDDISPLEIVTDQIKNIILNKRKVELANSLEQEVFEKAKTNNGFEIYN